MPFGRPAARPSSSTSIRSPARPIPRPRPSTRSALYQMKIDTNLNGFADIAYRIRFASIRTLSDGAASRTTPSSRDDRRLGPPGRMDRRHRGHGLHDRLQGRPALRPSSVAARPSPARATIPSSSICPGSSSSRSSCSPARPTSAVLLGGFTGTDTFAGHQHQPHRHRSPEHPPRRHRPHRRLLGDHVAAVRRRLCPGRADGPPGDQHGVQQHAMPRRKPLTGSSPNDDRRVRPGQRPRRAERDRQRARRQRAPELHRRPEVGHRHRAAAGHPDRQARRRQPGSSTGASSPMTSSMPSSRFSRTGTSRAMA